MLLGDAMPQLRMSASGCPMKRVEIFERDRGSHLTLRWRETDSNPRSPVAGWREVRFSRGENRHRRVSQAE
jgi:hypothetical protein